MKEVIRTAAAPGAVGPYSQAIRAGGCVWVSGQIPIDPATGIEHPVGAPCPLRGHAWSGDGRVSAMHVTLDFGQTWSEAKLVAPANPFAWQRWSAELRFPMPGYYEVLARATGRDGRQQPMVMPGWNPRGYLNNAMHRIAVRVV